MGWTSSWGRDRVPEMLWWGFVALNVAGIWLLQKWATVPFHFIWISLALMYGWRVWSLRTTVSTLLVVVVVTGAMLGLDVVLGYQAADELSEIPLMAAVFGAMVVYVRRGAAVQRETERVSERNRVLLEQNRRLVQNASHNLRTPLTIALGFTEVLQRTTVDPGAADDAQVVIDELQRLKKSIDRLLRLATSDQPGFLFRVEIPVPDLVGEVVGRWRRAGADVRADGVVDEVLAVDRDRIVELLDELVSNAVGHGEPATRVAVSSRVEGEWHVLSVADDGPGIPSSLGAGAFDRFAHLPEQGHRGFGLGLAIVKAIADAHGGSVRLPEGHGRAGTLVEVLLPRRESALPMAGAGTTSPGLEREGAQLG